MLGRFKVRPFCFLTQNLRVEYADSLIIALKDVKKRIKNLSYSETIHKFRRLRYLITYLMHNA